MVLVGGKGPTPGEPLTGTEVVVAFNPIAGRRHTGRIAERLAALIGDYGFKVHFCESIWQGSDLAAAIFEGGSLRAFVGVGGDGTLATQVNRTPPGLPLALYPAGTGNVFAKSLKLPRNPRKFARAIACGKLMWLDAGVANGTLFLNLVSCGFDAAVATAVHEARLQEGRSGHIGYRSYLRPILSTITKYRFNPISVTVVGASSRMDCGRESLPRGEAGECRASTQDRSGDRELPSRVSSSAEASHKQFSESLPHQSNEAASGDWTQPADLRIPGGEEPRGEFRTESTHQGRWVFVCNMPRYGWGVKIAPGASPQDGLLDCWVFRGGGLWHGLRYVIAVQCGGLHRWMPDCFRIRGTKFVISGPEWVPCQRDGDPAGTLPMEVTVLRGRVRVVVP